MKWLLRYSADGAFIAAAPVFWMVVFYILFGFLLLPGDPGCHFEPGGCPEPGLITQAAGVVLGLAAFPLTCLGFVLDRQSVRRALGLPQSRASNDR